MNGYRAGALHWISEISPGSGKQSICPDGEISVSTARDLIFCWGPGLVSVDRRWQIKAELGADLLAQYSLLTDKQTEVREETASPAISPCLWTPSSDPHGSGAWPFLDLSLWCGKEIPWPGARRQEEKLHRIPPSCSSWRSSFRSRFFHSLPLLSFTAACPRHSGPRRPSPSNIWGHFISLRASLLVFCLEMKWVCPGPPGRRRRALQGVCPLSLQRGNKSSFRSPAVPKSMCSLLSLQHLWSHLRKTIAEGS